MSVINRLMLKWLSVLIIIIWLSYYVGFSLGVPMQLSTVIHRYDVPYRFTVVLINIYIIAMWIMQIVDNVEDER